MMTSILITRFLAAMSNVSLSTVYWDGHNASGLKEGFRLTAVPPGVGPIYVPTESVATEYDGPEAYKVNGEAQPSPQIGATKSALKASATSFAPTTRNFERLSVPDDDDDDDVEQLRQQVKQSQAELTAVREREADKREKEKLRKQVADLQKKIQSAKERNPNLTVAAVNSLPAAKSKGSRPRSNASKQSKGRRAPSKPPSVKSAKTDKSAAEPLSAEEHLSKALSRAALVHAAVNNTNVALKYNGSKKLVKRKVASRDKKETFTFYELEPGDYGPGRQSAIVTNAKVASVHLAKAKKLGVSVNSTWLYVILLSLLSGAKSQCVHPYVFDGAASDGACVPIGCSAQGRVESGKYAGRVSDLHHLADVSFAGAETHFVVHRNFTPSSGMPGCTFGEAFAEFEEDYFSCQPLSQDEQAFMNRALAALEEEGLGDSLGLFFADVDTVAGVPKTGALLWHAHCDAPVYFEKSFVDGVGGIIQRPPGAPLGFSGPVYDGEPASFNQGHVSCGEEVACEQPVTSPVIGLAADLIQLYEYGTSCANITRTVIGCGALTTVDTSAGVRCTPPSILVAWTTSGPCTPWVCDSYAALPSSTRSTLATLANTGVMDYSQELVHVSYMYPSDKGEVARYVRCGSRLFSTGAVEVAGPRRTFKRGRYLNFFGEDTDIWAAQGTSPSPTASPSASSSQSQSATHTGSVSATPTSSRTQSPSSSAHGASTSTSPSVSATPSVTVSVTGSPPTRGFGSSAAPYNHAVWVCPTTPVTESEALALWMAADCSQDGCCFNEEDWSAWEVETDQTMFGEMHEGYLCVTLSAWLLVCSTGAASSATPTVLATALVLLSLTPTVSASPTPSPSPAWASEAFVAVGGHAATLADCSSVTCNATHVGFTGSDESPTLVSGMCSYPNGTLLERHTFWEPAPCATCAISEMNLVCSAASDYNKCHRCHSEVCQGVTFPIGSTAASTGRSAYPTCECALRCGVETHLFLQASLPEQKALLFAHGFGSKQTDVCAEIDTSLSGRTFRVVAPATCLITNITAVAGSYAISHFCSGSTCAFDLDPPLSYEGGNDIHFIIQGFCSTVHFGCHTTHGYAVGHGVEKFKVGWGTIVWVSEHDTSGVLWASALGTVLCIFLLLLCLRVAHFSAPWNFAIGVLEVVLAWLVSVLLIVPLTAWAFCTGHVPKRFKAPLARRVLPPEEEETFSMLSETSKERVVRNRAKWNFRAAFFLALALLFSCSEPAEASCYDQASISTTMPVVRTAIDGQNDRIDIRGTLLTTFNGANRTVCIDIGDDHFPLELTLNHLYWDTTHLTYNSGKVFMREDTIKLCKGQHKCGEESLYVDVFKNQNCAAAPFYGAARDASIFCSMVEVDNDKSFCDGCGHMHSCCETHFCEYALQEPHKVTRVVSATPRLVFTIKSIGTTRIELRNNGDTAFHSPTNNANLTFALTAANVPPPPFPRDFGWFQDEHGATAYGPTCDYLDALCEPGHVGRFQANQDSTHVHTVPTGMFAVSGSCLASAGQVALQQNDELVDRLVRGDRTDTFSRDASKYGVRQLTDFPFTFDHIAPFSATFSLVIEGSAIVQRVDQQVKGKTTSAPTIDGCCQCPQGFSATMDVAKHSGNAYFEVTVHNSPASTHDEPTPTQNHFLLSADEDRLTVYMHTSDCNVAAVLQVNDQKYDLVLVLQSDTVVGPPIPQDEIADHTDFKRHRPGVGNLFHGLFDLFSFHLMGWFGGIFSLLVIIGLIWCLCTCVGRPSYSRL